MTELESPAPRQRSGRAARAAARSGNGRRSGPAFIRREIPTFDLLSEEGLDLVEQHADRLLADVGIEIRDDSEALQLLRDAGASVDGVDRKSTRLNSSH